MNIKELQQNWNDLATTDPLWAILSDPDKKSNRWDPDDFMATGRSEIGDLVERVHHLGLPLSRGRALDFGCGVGRLSQALAEYFDEVIGVDISAKMVEQARARNQHGSRCRYELNDRPDLSRFASENFDLIYSVLALQHIPPRYARRYIAEFMRVLRPGGVLVFQLPSPTAAMSGNITRRLKIASREFIPARAHRLYRQLRGGPLPPFEMYGMTPLRVMRLLHAEGARVLKLESHEDKAAGWTDLRYFATRATGGSDPPDRSGWSGPRVTSTA